MSNEATIRNFRKAYLLEFTKDKTLSTAEHGKIEAKKRGKPLLFGEYDKLIVDYVRRLRKHGAVVNSRIVMGTARGIFFEKGPTAIARERWYQKIK